MWREGPITYRPLYAEQAEEEGNAVVPSTPRWVQGTSLVDEPSAAEHIRCRMHLAARCCGQEDDDNDYSDVRTTAVRRGGMMRTKGSTKVHEHESASQASKLSSRKTVL